MSVDEQKTQMYDVTISHESVDSDWDAFVATRPGCPYVQSSAWAEVKSVVGWRAARVIVRRSGRIMGGCQLLLRPLRGLGSIAFAPRAPLVAEEEPQLLDAVMGGLDELAAGERLLYCKLQPPGGQCDLSRELEQRGWVESGLDAGTTATVRIDLRLEPEDLMRNMRASTRRNIRSASRRGVRVRSGGYTDLLAFWELVSATSRRQRFSAYSAHYYQQMWRSFSERGDVGLLLVEQDGELLAGHLLLGFGDTAVYKMGAWSGARSKVHPNEIAQWTAMSWGRERGYRYYDFDGIELEAARAVAAGKQPPEAAGLGVTYFKLGFGGDVVIYPAAYDRSYRALLASPVRWLAPRLRPGGLALRIAGRG
jgi:lipid II:glycine glycyltransferase (peptidoglycan interpeptide bridge formation enzyme)